MLVAFKYVNMLHPDACKGLYLLDMFDDHVWS